VTRHVHSRDNPLFKSLQRLAASSRERRARGATLLDGPHLIEAHAQAGGVADLLAIAQSAHARASARALFESVPARVRVILDDALLGSIAQVATPAGLLAVIPIPPAPAPPRGAETCLLLDGLQDPGNVGSILRTAVAAGVRHVFLSRGCVFAWSPKVLRAGQGAHFSLAIHEHAALDTIIERYGGTVAATAPNGTVSIFEADLARPVAWLFGAEGSGVSADLAARAALRLCIPMPGPAESLNVAAAVAVCLFEQVRQQGRRVSRRDVPPSRPA
jgi:TrmH family RNA methyltransferase